MLQKRCSIQGGNELLAAHAVCRLSTSLCMRLNVARIYTSVGANADADVNREKEQLIHTGSKACDVCTGRDIVIAALALA